MSHYQISAGDLYDRMVGHPYVLLVDGERCFGGCHADCLDWLLYWSVDGRDTASTGTVPHYQMQPVEGLRREHRAFALACGQEVDECGRVVWLTGNICQ